MKRLGILATTTVIGLAVLNVGGCGSSTGVDEPAAHSRDEIPSFWALLSHGARTTAALEVEHYSSLQELMNSADLVLSARIEDVSEGRVFGGLQYVALRLEPITVFAGELPDTEPVLLEIAMPGPIGIKKVMGADLSQEAVYFLRNKGVEGEALGLPEAEVEEEGKFFRITNSQGLWANIEGQATAAFRGGPGEGQPLSEFRGEPFDQVLSAVQAAADIRKSNQRAAADQRLANLSAFFGG